MGKSCTKILLNLFVSQRGTTTCFNTHAATITTHFIVLSKITDEFTGRRKEPLEWRKVTISFSQHVLAQTIFTILISIPSNLSQALKFMVFWVFTTNYSKISAFPFSPSSESILYLEVEAPLLFTALKYEAPLLKPLIYVYLSFLSLSA